MRKLLLLCTYLIAGLLTQNALAANLPMREEITSFNTIIYVNVDASINVTETIKVYSLGDKIKRGIVRTLPKSYRDSYGVSRRNTYDLQSVLVNGKKSPYHIRQDRKQFSIYVGDKDHYLKPGWYTYTFKYKTENAVNFLKDADELYWNVTGNDWAFPILEVNARVTLPPGTKIKYFRGYTGKKGEAGLNYTPEQLGPDIINFTTTKPLPAGSGLTVAIAWPKGVVVPPTLMKRMNAHLDLNAGSYIVIEIAVITLLYFLLVWQMHGQDPDKGPIFPRFTPPENISPMFARYLMRMGYDNKILTTCIVWLATRGFITIADPDNEFTLSRVQNPKNTPNEDEASLLSNLFGSKDKLKLETSNRSKVLDIKKALKKQMNNNNLGYYFVTNTKYIFPGIALLVFAATATVIYAHDPYQAGFAIVWLSGWTVGTFFLLYQAWTLWRRALSAGGGKTYFSAIFSSLFALPFLVGEIFGIFMLANSIPIFTIPFLFLIGALIAIFYILMKQPTDVGRKIMDEIEGFKLYLATTEEYRLKSYEPPEMTVELYEKYLPYAIALDVENDWGNQLDSKLKAAGQTPQSYQPHWYSGNSWSSNSPAAFNSLMAAGIGSALASTSVSSSASGGGGYSGGGGGGGGGGGW